MGNLGEMTISALSFFLFIRLPNLGLPYFLPPAPNPSGWVFSLTQLWSIISSRLLICYQCKAQIHISKQWVSLSWFWFFCCLSGSVSVLQQITNPEHDTLQTPADHWGLTADVCVWLHRPTHKHTHSQSKPKWNEWRACVLVDVQELQRLKSDHKSASPLRISIWE